MLLRRSEQVLSKAHGREGEAVEDGAGCRRGWPVDLAGGADAAEEAKAKAGAAEEGEGGGSPQGAALGVEPASGARGAAGGGGGGQPAKAADVQGDPRGDNLRFSARGLSRRARQRPAHAHPFARRSRGSAGAMAWDAELSDLRGEAPQCDDQQGTAAAAGDRVS